MIHQPDNPETQAIDTLEQLICAYNEMRRTCLIRFKRVDTVEIKQDLIHVIWECDVTIAKLRLIIKQLQRDATCS